MTRGQMVKSWFACQRVNFWAAAPAEAIAFLLFAAQWARWCQVPPARMVWS